VVPQPRSSSSRRHWTTKEEVSRKKKKENVPAGQRGACSRKGATNARATSTYPTKLFNYFLFIYAILVHECFERPTLAYKFHDR
jgi:hypothetical protein